MLHNRFVGANNSSIVSWCPQMDLLTITINRMSLWVYRMNGERIYSVNNRSPITHVCWQPDGKSFALLGINGLCKIYDSNSGTLIHTIESQSLTMNVTQSIHWCDQNDFQQKQHANWDPKDAQQTSINPKNKYLGMFDLDFTKSLPILPSTDSEIGTVLANKICSQSMPNFDGLIKVDGTKSLSITINTVFTIQGIQAPPGIDVFLLLVSINIDKLLHLVNLQGSQLGLVAVHSKLDMFLEYLNFLSEVTSMGSKIFYLLAYIEESIAALLAPASSLLDVYERYLSNYCDTLYEGVDLTTSFPSPTELTTKMCNSLYRMLFSGLILTNEKDYWLNQFGDRGLKKLTSVGTSAYETVRKICFTQILAALERLLVILGRFEGLLAWLDVYFPKKEKDQDELQNTLGVNSKAIAKSAKAVSELINSAYKWMVSLDKEQKLFSLFSEWLKDSVVERLAKEDDISSNEPLNEKLLETSFSLTKVQQYIGQNLFHSELLSGIKGLDSKLTYISAKSDVKLYLIDQYEALKVMLQTDVLGPIQKVMSSRISFDDAINLKLPSTSPDNCQLEIVKSKNSSQSGYGFIFCISSDRDELFLVRFSTDTLKVDPVVKVSFTNTKILQCQLMKEAKLAILSKDDSQSIFQIVDLENLQLQSSNQPSNQVIPSENLPNDSVQTFDEATNGFSPFSFSLNSSNSKALVCLLDENKQKYLIVER